MSDQVNRYALLIANDRYRDLSALEFPEPDLEGLRTVLEDPEVGGFSRVEVLSNPDLETARAAIGELFAARQRDDLVVLYFSGCARRDPASDTLYLELADSRADLLRGTAVSAAFITTEMESSGARRQVLILDCRYMAGPEASGPVVSADDFGGAAMPEPAESPALLANGHGRVTLTSCITPSDPWEGNRVFDGVPRSLFTQFLIRALATGGSEWLTAEQLYRWLHRQLASAQSDGPQIPERFVHHQKGSLVVVGNPQQVADTVEPTPTRAAPPAIMRPEDLLPGELVQDLQSADAATRFGGVRELIDLMREPSLNFAIRAVLRGHLQSEQDEDVRAELASALGWSVGQQRPAPVPTIGGGVDDADSQDLSANLDSADLSADVQSEAVSVDVIADELDLIDPSLGELFREQASTEAETAGEEADPLADSLLQLDLDTEPARSQPTGPSPAKSSPQATPPEKESSDASAFARPAVAADEDDLSPGPNLIEAGHRDQRRLLGRFEPKRKKHEWVTWVLAGILAVVVVLALGYFFSYQIVSVLAPEQVGLRLAKKKGGNDADAASATAGPAPLSSLSDALGDGISGPEMVVIPAGRFMMGSLRTDPDRNWDERRHPVEIPQNFSIGRSEVTFEQYDHFARATDRPIPESKVPNRGARPAVQISWYDAMAYADWLSAKTGARYRLPTEAEWEYAARAGGKVPVGVADCKPVPKIDDRARTAPPQEPAVKRDCRDPVDAEVSAAPTENPWGLKYMAGNVWEWTCSRYVRSYDGSEKICATRASDGEVEQLRAIRGGSHVSQAKWLRATSRDTSRPSGRSALLGFRLARELDQRPAAGGPPDAKAD